MDIKAGWKTTEFWLSLAAIVLGAVLTSGLLDAYGSWDRIVGVVVATLAALGYSRDRRMVKTQQIKPEPAKPPAEGIEWDARGATDAEFMLTTLAMVGLIFLLAYGGCSGGWRSQAAKGLAAVQHLGDEAAVIVKARCGSAGAIVDQCIRDGDQDCSLFHVCYTAQRAIHSHFVAVLAAKHAVKASETEGAAKTALLTAKATAGDLCASVRHWTGAAALEPACAALRAWGRQ